MLAVFVMLTLWYAGAVVAKFHFAVIIGAIIWGTFIFDYLIHLTGKNLTEILQSFPPPRIQPGTKRLSYDEIIQIYVEYRRKFYSLIGQAQEQRCTNKHQFLVFALFFSGLFTAIIYLFRPYFLLSMLVLAILILPGAIRNNLPLRLWIIVYPYLQIAFDKLNISLQNFLEPPVKPAQGSKPRPVSPVVPNRPPSVVNPPSQPPAYSQATNPSQYYQPQYSTQYSTTSDYKSPTYTFDPSFPRPSQSRLDAELPPIQDQSTQRPSLRDPVSTENIPTGQQSHLYYNSNIAQRNPYHNY